MNLMNRTRQRRHYLKAAYFYHAEDKAFIAWTPPHVVSHMSKDQWGKLVDKWSTPRSKVASLFTEPYHWFNPIIWSEPNLFLLFVQVACKRAAYSGYKFQFPATTGSCSYEVGCDRGKDAVKLFKVTHKSRGGFSSPVKRAIVSPR